MKFISGVLSGVIVGAIGLYLTLSWSSEKLEYFITDPAKFGEITYQNITLANAGWDVAQNIKLYIENPEVKFENVKTNVAVKEVSSEKNGILQLDRLRKEEKVVFSIAYKGSSILPPEIKILSDRSVAVSVRDYTKSGLPSWFNNFFSVLVSIYFILLISELINRLRSEKF